MTSSRAGVEPSGPHVKVPLRLARASTQLAELGGKRRQVACDPGVN
jgi:hypothetical protein